MSEPQALTQGQQRPSMPATTPTSKARSKRWDMESILDNVVVFAVLGLALAMALVIPLAYISREAGASVGDTFRYLAHNGVVLAHRGWLGHTWPFSAALDAVEDSEYFQSLSGKGLGRRKVAEISTHDVDGVPIEQATGFRIPDVLAEDDEMLAEYAGDDSYTRFEDTAIFFRVLPRKVPISSKTGRPQLRFLYQLTGGDRSKLRDAKEKLRVEREDERERLAKLEPLSYDGKPRARQQMADSFGMAEINPETNTLAPPQEGVPIPCTHPANDMYIDYRQVTLLHAVIIEDTYVNHPGDPYAMESLAYDHMQPCLRHILPMMCVGDKWEIICPRNMTHRDEKITLRSFAFRVDIRDLAGPTRSLEEAAAALARGVFLTDTDASGSVVDVIFTREMLLERAKRRPPRIKL